MNSVLERFCRALVALDWNIFAKDADKWITVHPNGSQGKGRPALIDGETGRVKGGMGGKFNGQKISEVRKSFRGPKTPTPEQKKQAAEQTMARKYAQASQNGSEADKTSAGNKVKKLRGENRKRTTMDFIRHQFGVDLTDAVKRDHKGNPVVFFPEANGSMEKNKQLIDYRLKGPGHAMLEFEDNGGLGVVVKLKDEAMLARHAERMKTEQKSSAPATASGATPKPTPASTTKTASAGDRPAPSPEMPQKYAKYSLQRHIDENTEYAPVAQAIHDMANAIKGHELNILSHAGGYPHWEHRDKVGARDIKTILKDADKQFRTDPDKAFHQMFQRYYWRAMRQDNVDPQRMFDKFFDSAPHPPSEDEPSYKGREEQFHNAARLPNGLTRRQENSVYNYTSFNGWDINKALRKGSGAVGELSDVDKKTIHEMDKLFRKTKTTEPILARRWVSGKSEGGVPWYDDLVHGKLKPGSTLRDDAYMSTTTGDVSKFVSGKNPVIMNIMIPKGSRAFSTGRHTTGMSMHEIVADRGSSVKVLKTRFVKGKDGKDGHWEIDGELVQPEAKNG